MTEQVVRIRLVGDGRGLEVVLDKSADKLRGLKGASGEAGAGLRAGERDAGAFAGSMRRGMLETTALTTVLRYVGPAVIAMGLKRAAAEAREFAASMAEVATLSDFAKRDLAPLSDEVRKLAVQYAQSPTAEAKALYDIISAGASSSEEAVRLLHQANLLAVGGVTSVAVAADGLTSVLNAYGPAAGGAANVSDALFVTMREGKTTVGELSAEIGKVAPLAAGAGVSLDALLAGVAALTKGGIETNRAITGLRAIFAAIVKPSSEAATLAKELGIEFSAAGLQAKGFTNFLAELVEKTGGSTEKLGLLFGGVEALVPVMALTGAAGEAFAATLDKLEDKAGATASAVQTVTENAAFWVSRFASAMKDMALDAGNALIEGVGPGAKFVVQNFEDIKRIGLDVVQVLAVLATTVGGAALFRAIATAAGPAAAGMLSAALATNTYSAAAFAAAISTRALGASMAFFGGPVGAAIAAAGVAYVLLADSTDAAAEAAERARQKLYDLNDEIAKGTPKSIDAAEAKLSEARANEELARSALDAAEAELKLAEARLARELSFGTNSGFVRERAIQQDIDVKREGLNFAGGELDVARGDVETLQAAIAKLREEIDTPAGGAGGGGLGGSLDELRTSFDAVLKAADPVGAAIRDYRDAVSVLDQALKAGLIPSTAEHARLQKGLDQALGETLSKQPAEEIEKWAQAQANLADRTVALAAAERMRAEAKAGGLKFMEEERRAMAEELRLAGLTEEQRQIELRTRELILKAKREGVTVSEAEARAEATAHEARMQALREQQREAQRWEEVFSSVARNMETGFKDAFKEAFRESGGGFDRLMEGFKEGFLDMLAELAFQALAKPILIPMLQGLGGAMGLSPNQVQNVLGQGGLGGTGSGGLGGLSNLLSLADLFGSGSGGLGGVLSQLGGLFGLGGGAASSNAALAAWTSIGPGAGAAASGAAGGAAGAGGLTAGLAAVPVWGWIALAAMTAKGFVEGAEPGSAKGAINTLLLPSIEEWQSDPGRSFANAIDPIGMVLSDFGLPSFLTAGGLLGGLLGKKEPSNKFASTSIDIAGGTIADATFDPSERSQRTIDASQTMAKVFLEAAQMIEELMGGSGPTGAFVVAGERDGIQVGVGNAGIKFGDPGMKSFTDPEAAVGWMIETFISKIEGGDPEMQRVADLNKGKGPEVLLEALAKARNILDALGSLSENDNLSRGAQAVQQLTEEIEALRIAARDIGLSDAVQAEIGAAEIFAREQLTKGFDDAVQRAIMAALDPVQLAWNDLMDIQAERLRDVAALSGDVAEAERLNLIERQTFMMQLTAEQRAAMGELVGIADDLGFRLGEVQAAAAALVAEELSGMQARAREIENNAALLRRFADSAEATLLNLRGGALSPLTPAQKFDAARMRLDDLEARAGEGDMDAMAQLPQAVTAFVEASRGYHADAAAFLADFARGEAILEAMRAAGVDGAEAADAELEALEASRSLLEDIRDALSKASPDADILAAHMTALAALGLDGTSAIVDKLAELISVSIETQAALAATPSAPPPVYSEPLAATPDPEPAPPPPPAPPPTGPLGGALGQATGRSRGGFRRETFAERMKRLGVPGYAAGGLHAGEGTGTSDSLVGLFSHGEFTLQASAVRNYGLPMVEAMNEGRLKLAAANDGEKLGPRLDAIERRLATLTEVAASGAEGTIDAIERGNEIGERGTRIAEQAAAVRTRGRG